MDLLVTHLATEEDTISFDAQLMTLVSVLPAFFAPRNSFIL
jgi:hypothetical protein